MICIECGGDCVETTEPMATEYKGVEIIVSDIPHWKCSVCGEEMLSAEACKAYTDEILRIYEEGRLDGE